MDIVSLVSQYIGDFNIILKLQFVSNISQGQTLQTVSGLDSAIILRQFVMALAQFNITRL